MDDWGGAQWFILFWVATRFVFAWLVTTGVLIPVDTSRHKWSRFAGGVLSDLLTIAVLYWGGFW